MPDAPDTRATITFYGGAGSVTGAQFLLDTGGTLVLVDCGLLQGGADAETYNHQSFAYDPAEVGTLIITHAHLDHIGRVPKLVRDGFSGTIYSTAPTKELAALMFEDALELMDRAAREEGTPMLYKRTDVDRALSQWETCDYHETIGLADDVSMHFRDAGHILGSAMAVLDRGGRRLVFTGDLGNTPAPILRDTEALPEDTHYLVTESVYGDRVHEKRDARTDLLVEAIEEVRRSGGTLLIPSFSIQRTQILLYEINNLIEDGVIDPLPVFLDSPLAIQVTDVYRRYPHLFNTTVRNRLAAHDEDVFAFPGLSMTMNVAESRAIREAPNPKIIIAGSGMSHGGRIRAHEKHSLGDPNATLLFVGFQTPGSLGRRLQDGEKRVRIDDTWVRVRARIRSISGYSAHKDRDGIVDLIATAAPSLEQVFVCMGEPGASFHLAQRLHDFLDVDTLVPERGASHEVRW